MRTVAIFLFILAALLALHFPLLRLPYFWDEAGYYVPAARDILLTGSLIPHSTLSNAHPPLLLAYLAFAWKFFGFTPLVTRCAMLLVSAFCLLGVFRFARRIANTPVAIGSIVALALYPVYFTQSSMAHMDLGAAAFVVWGLDSYLISRGPTSARLRQVWASIAFFSAAALTKETAILVPVALLACEVLLRFPRLSAIINRQPALDNSIAITRPPDHPLTRSCLLLLPALPLAAWFFFHYLKTGHVFGNPEFFHYNLADNFHPIRILIALALHLWHLLGYMNMALLVAAVLLAMTISPRPIDARKSKSENNLRPRISIPTQLLFAVLVLTHLLAFSILGGAVLARYLLPIYPLTIILGVSTLRRRLPRWPLFLAVICLGFVVALITEPPYRFAPEDNLAYSDYVRLHQTSARFLSQRFPNSTVLTAWPASDELTRPWLGYVDKPLRILRIDNFAVEQLLAVADFRGQYQVALIFSTKEEPRLLVDFAGWERLQARFFGYHRDLRPAEAAQLLGGRVIFSQHRGPQWVAVIALDTIENAARF